MKNVTEGFVISSVICDIAVWTTTTAMRRRWDDPPKPSSDAGWMPTAAGAIAGSAMTAIGHPFDTTKVRMQAMSEVRFTSTMHCLSHTIAKEGVLGLYKGLSPALMTTMATSGLRFGVQHEFNARLSAHLTGLESASAADFEQLPLLVRMIAEGGGGAVCGLVLPLIYTPMELIKCRRQVLSNNSITNWQIARNVWREEGIRGLYTGHPLTVARSTLGNASLFGSYEAWKTLLQSTFGAERGSLCMVAGVLSGWTTQIVCFPIDAAKSRQQVAGGEGLLRGILALWREGAMYRGVSAMLLRAVPVHAVYMPTYTFVLRCLSAPSSTPVPVRHVSSSVLPARDTGSDPVDRDDAKSCRLTEGAASHQQPQRLLRRTSTHSDF